MLFSRFQAGGNFGLWDILVHLPTSPEEAILDSSSIIAPRTASGHFKPVRHCKVEGRGLRVHSADLKAIGFPSQETYAVVTSLWQSPYFKDSCLWVAPYQTGAPQPPPRFRARANGAFVTGFCWWQERDGFHETKHFSYFWMKDGSRCLSCRFWVDSDGSYRSLEWNPWSDGMTILGAEPINLCSNLCNVIFNQPMPYEFTSRFGELTVPALEQMRATLVNGFEFAQDLNLIKQVTELGLAVRSLNAKLTLKELSDIYLSYNFGTMSTARDYLALADSVATELSAYADAKVAPYRKVRARQHFTAMFLDRPWTVNTSLTAYMDDEEQTIKGMMTSLRSWGWYPDRETVWALVPFSFVVDWFLNIDSCLSKLDAGNWRQYYNCHACILSYKATNSWIFSGESPDFLTVGTARITLYNRIIQRELPMPLVKLELTLPKTFRQWITGTALVIQKHG